MTCSPKYFNISFFLEQEILFKNYNITINIWKLTFIELLFNILSLFSIMTSVAKQNNHKKTRQHIRVVVFFLYAHIICNQVRSFSRFLKNYVYVCMCLYVCTCTLVWVFSEAGRCQMPWSWVTGCCEPSDVGAGDKLGSSAVAPRAAS